MALGKMVCLPKTCPKCKAINAWVLVQYGRFSGPEDIGGCHPCHVDGWSEIQCKHCLVRIGGWSERVLEGDFKDGEHEAPYGGEHRKGCRFAPREPVKLTLVKESA